MVDDYWGPSKRVLADPKFLESLIEYDKDNIQAGVMKKISDCILQDESFEPDKFESTAAKGIYLPLPPPPPPPPPLPPPASSFDCP
jgi:dynein heavy chain